MAKQLGTPKSIFEAVEGDEVVFKTKEMRVQIDPQGRKSLQVASADLRMEVLTENELDNKIAVLEAELVRLKDLQKEIKK